MRRVVVTGLGAVTPLGAGLNNVWDRLLKGESGAAEIQSFDTNDLSVKIACQVPTGGADPGVFNPDDYLPPKDQRKVDQFIIFALGAAAEAIEDSGWSPRNDEDAYRTGVMIGSGIGGLATIAEAATLLQEKGPRRISPFFIPSSLINLASGQVSIKYGFKGPNHA
ncbi:MAG: beta-ketoacyl synthase N-terminal-like domain-containing protein, partial [Pseudomonadota bacterium]|nr:beta-ketoacyl synthase N-terminal-like domain-containing protein [Pseudomonadota bacterium]